MVNCGSKFILTLCGAVPPFQRGQGDFLSCGESIHNWIGLKPYPNQHSGKNQGLNPDFQKHYFLHSMGFQPYAGEKKSPEISKTFGDHLVFCYYNLEF